MKSRKPGMILSQLFGAAKSSLFDHAVWPDRPVVHHGPVSRLPEIFRNGDISSVDRLAASIETPDARGVDNVATGYRGDAIFLGARGTQRGFSIRAASASRLYRAGLNIMFHEFRLPSVEPWLEALATEIGIANRDIRMYGFAAPPGTSNGTDPHWDPNEVIHIQLCGRKTFRLAPNAHVEQPSHGGIARDSFSEDAVAEMNVGVPLDAPKKWEVVELKPGSVLYFPRGTWHQTDTTEKSFAIGLGLYWPTALDLVLSHLKMQLRQDVEWRRPLFGLLKDGPERARLEAALAPRLREVGLHDPSAAATALAGLGGLERRMAAQGESLQFARMPMILDATRSGGSWKVVVLTQKGHDRLELEVDDGLLRALEWIARRRPSFGLPDLRDNFPEVHDDDWRALLASLVSIAALQIDPRKRPTAKPR